MVSPLRWHATCCLEKSQEQDVTIETNGDRVYEYQGYSIERNPTTGRWEVFWRERKQTVDFERVADAEEWIDDQVPSHRF
jgi:hypothetical protein